MSHVTNHAAALTGCLVLVGGGAARTQAPENPLIVAAAAQINAITPQAVPAQTIRVGMFDGATRQFHWLLPEEYPYRLPAWKRSDQGGTVKPDHVAAINSFNVTYEFDIQNRPAGFKLTLRTRGPDGSWVEKVATVSGSVARVSFNPHSFAEQIVTITGNGNTVLRINPVLQSQLGAFVVPQLLLAIVYEPPGATSFASFGNRQTATTSLSWGFERSSGLVSTVALDEFTKQLEAVQGFVKGVGTAAAILNGMFAVQYASQVESIAGPVGQALEMMHTVMGQTATITQTQGQTGFESQGLSISVEVGVSTNVENGNQYAGGDDRFVHLHDVLYMYLVLGRKVVLAPVSYGGWHAPTAAGLLQELPQIAPHWIALDPLLSGALSGKRPAPGPVDFENRAPRWPQPWRFEQPSWLPALPCEDYGPAYEQLTEEQFTTVGTGRTTTKTTLTHSHGLEALVGSAPGDSLESVTYTNSQERTDAQATVAYVEVKCPPGQQYQVDLYIDKVFRTILPVRGEPQSGAEYVSGTVSDGANRPVPRQMVTLTVGRRSYATLTDANGNFRFRFGTPPRGQGVLKAGRTASVVALTGTPVSGVRLAVADAPGPPKRPTRTTIQGSERRRP